MERLHVCPHCGSNRLVVSEEDAGGEIEQQEKPSTATDGPGHGHGPDCGAGHGDGDAEPEPVHDDALRLDGPVAS